MYCICEPCPEIMDSPLLSTIPLLSYNEGHIFVLWFCYIDRNLEKALNSFPTKLKNSVI